MTVPGEVSRLRIALVCSWLNQYGGAERVLEILHEMYPDAPIYTSIFEPRRMPTDYQSWDIRTSFMQRLPFVKTHHQFFLPLYPLAFEQFDLSQYDLVINNSSAFSYGVLTRPETRHVCYCLTPARFLWNYHQYARREGIGTSTRFALAPVLSLLRLWDVQAARRVDDFIAISQLVARRIAKCYGRSAPVIFPPVDASSFSISPRGEIGDYYLIVSRLIPYKRVDLAVAAFNLLGLPLKIVGDGRDRRALERLGSPGIEFLGRTSDDELRKLYSHCKALIFPGEEDFGLTPLEAQASGRPVIAYAAGGALETVVPEETGAFFYQQTPEALAEAVSEFDTRKCDPDRIRRHACEFDVQVFKRRFQQHIETGVGAWS